MKKVLFIVIICLSFSLVLADWSDNPSEPNLIAGFASEQVLPKVAITRNGNTYISRFDNNDGGYNLYLNLLNYDGNSLWANPDGLLISNHPQATSLTEYAMTTDDEGNAIIVFQDIRNSEVHNIVAYKISQEGEFLWGADGIMISNDTSTEVSNLSPTVFCASDNSIYMTWQNIATTTSIVINRLNSSGQKLWGEDGIILSYTEGNCTWPQIIQSDNNNILLKYYQDSGPFWAPNRHIFVRKLTPEGTLLWESTITNAGGITAWEQLIPFVSDGIGGAVLSWYEDREQDMDNDIYCQHITSEGNITMVENGVLAIIDPYNQQYYPTLSIDEANRHIYIFSSISDANQDNYGLAGQLLDYTGNRLWGNTGQIIINIGPTTVTTIDAYYTNSGAVCVYEIDESIYASAWLSDGTMSWNQDTIICSSNDLKYHYDLATHPDQWSVLTWEQGYNNMDIYAMRFNSDGSLGTKYPAPVNLNATLNFPDIIYLSWSAPSLYLIPDSYYIYINNEFSQQVSGDTLSYEYSGFPDGYYSFYVIARYGEHYSEPSETVNIQIVSNDDNLVPTNKSSFSLYPNPFRDELILQWGIPKNETYAKIIIYNLKGQKIKEWELNPAAGNYNLRLSEELNVFSSGIYFIRLETSSEVRVIKSLCIK